MPLNQSKNGPLPNPTFTLVCAKKLGVGGRWALPVHTKTTTLHIAYDFKNARQAILFLDSLCVGTIFIWQYASTAVIIDIFYSFRIRVVVRVTNKHTFTLLETDSATCTLRFITTS